MGIIKNREDIDYDKLKALMKKRGHDIVNPEFFDLINPILDGESKDEVVYQCECGEVGYLNKEIAKVIIKDLGSDKIPCKNCGLHQYMQNEGVYFEFKLLQDYEKIIDIVEKRLIKNPRGNVKDIMDEINAINPNLLQADNPQELFFKMHKFNLFLSKFNSKKSPSVILIKEIVEKAKKNKKEFIKFYSNHNIAPISAKNTLMVDIQNRHYQQLQGQARFYGLSGLLDSNFTAGFQQKELDINAKLNSYNHMLEDDVFLFVLMNLIRLIEGMEFSDKPFKKEAINGKGKKIDATTLYQKICAFENYVSGKSIYYMLNSIFRRKIRNAHAHNDYEIILENQKIESKDTIDIEEFEKLHNEVSEVSMELYLAMQSAFYYFFPAIKHIKLGYDNPIIEGEELKPASTYTLPELHIEGFEFNEENKPAFQFKIEANQLMIFDENWHSIYPISNAEKLWLKQLKNANGNYSISLIDLDNENNPILSNVIEYKGQVDEAFFEEIKKLK